MKYNFLNKNKISSFFAKLIFAVLVIFCSISFSSCIFESLSEHDSSNEKNKTYYTISGKADSTLATNTSLREAERQSNLINDEVSTGSTTATSARTALPSVSSSNIKYYITATESSSSSSSETVTSDVFDLGTNFTIELTSGTWTLTATAYYSSDTAKTAIMSGSESVTVSSSDLSDVSIALLPSSTGTGTVALSIGFDSSSTGIAKMTANWTLNGTAYSKSVTDGTVSTFDLLPDTSAYTEVPAGTHTVSFTFYDSSYNVKYWFSQVINVFSGMTTDTWIKGNAKYIDTTSNQVYITSDLVKEFVTTSYFVSSSGSDTTGDGSYFAPYATLQKAVEVIEALEITDTDTYTIYLLSDITGTDDGATTSSTSSVGDSLINIEPSSTFNLTIEPLGTNVLTIDAARTSSSSKTYRIMNIGENATVTLNNLILKGGYSTANGGAIYIAGNSTTKSILTLNNCTLGSEPSETFSDGTQNTSYAPTDSSNSNCSASYGGGIYESYASVILNNTKIVNNYAKDSGGGIYLTYSELEIDSDSEFYANGADGTGSGAAISTYMSTVNLNGKIHHNYSAATAGIAGINLSASTLNMNSGATIQDNYSTSTSSYGTGICASSSATVNINGGTIKNNSYIDSTSSICNCDIGYTSSVTSATVNLSGDSYVETIYSVAAPINISGTLTGFSLTNTCKIYTTITVGNTVLQTSDSSISLSDYLSYFELYDCSTYTKASDYQLKINSTDSTKAIISELLYETVYLDTTSGLDTNAGTSYSVPVLTMEKAVSKLDTSATSPTIYVMNEINVSSDESSASYWTFALSGTSPTVTLKRYDGTSGGSAFTGSILTVASGGTVNATGIIFDGNTSVSGTAPLVDVESGGTLTLNTCYLQNNTSSKSTGGINVSGTVSLYDCSVKNNTATKSAGILIDTSYTFYMKGGEISGNTAKTYNGGGLQVTEATSGNAFLKNVSITGNEATKANGGGIAISSAKYLALEGCTITGNKATAGSGGGIYIAGNLSLFGTIDISDNTAASYGANICWANDSNSKTIALGTDSKELTLAGIVQTPATLSVASGKSICATITPASSSNSTSTSYVIGTKLLKSANDSGSVASFVDLFTIDDDDTTDSYTWYIDDDGKLQKRTSADVAYYVSSSGDDSAAGTKDAPFATVQAAVNAITASSIDITKTYAIFLLSDITATSSSTFTDSSFVKIAPTAALNLVIESYDAGKVYAINAGGSSVALGRCLYINTATSSTITLNNMQITGGYTTSANGGGIYIAGSSTAQPTLVLDGNTIIGNAIEVTDGTQATADLLTASDFGNVANGTCGGIYASYANVTMNGNSSVAHNSSLNSGSAIRLNDNSCVLTIGTSDNHAPSVYGNYITQASNSYRAAIFSLGTVYLYGSVHHNVDEYGSSAFELRNNSVLYMYDGSSIHDNLANDGYGGAININNDYTATAYIYGGSFSNNHTENSSNYEINFSNISSASRLYIDPTKVTFDDYNYAILLGDGNFVSSLASFASATNSYIIKMNSYTSDNAVLKGSDLSGSEYTLTESDLNYVKAVIGSDTTEYSLKLDSANNQATIDLPSSSGSGSLTVKINDNITMSLSASELSSTAATTLTLTATANGTATDITSSNTTVALYNGGVLYADSSVTTSVTADNTITVSGAVAPGSYQLVVTFTYGEEDYQATFDLTAEDTD